MLTATAKTIAESALRHNDYSWLFPPRKLAPLFARLCRPHAPVYVLRYVKLNRFASLCTALLCPQAPQTREGLHSHISPISFPAACAKRKAVAARESSALPVLWRSPPPPQEAHPKRYGLCHPVNRRSLRLRRLQRRSVSGGCSGLPRRPQHDAFSSDRRPPSHPRHVRDEPTQSLPDVGEGRAAARERFRGRGDWVRRRVKDCHGPLRMPGLK
jgi:hypothetical protein